MKRALITGVTGQDGSYLAELLLEKGYEVHGLVRRTSTVNTERIQHLLNAEKLTLHQGDMTDAASLIGVMDEVRPDELYNLAAQSHVGISFKSADYTAEVDALGVLRLLDAMHITGQDHTCRLYQASTSELFGKVEACPQDENTPFHPFSPYAIAKQFGYWTVREYREAYGVFACNGILFNHESERRGEGFVTRKITRAAGRIACGLQDRLELGNLDSLRDWGFAGDYVDCMWRMLQQPEPDDYVVATGTQHSVREFTELAFRYAGMELEWRGRGLEEKGYDRATGRLRVCVNPRWFRPTDVVNLCGNPAKARERLGWDPNGTGFEALCRRMAEHDLALARREAGLEP